MAARLLVYAGRVIERHVTKHPNATKIPALVPVVLYHGEGGWSAATELFDLYALPEDLKPTLRGLVPSLRFLLDDLGQTGDENLRQRSGPVLARVALIVLRHAQELRTAQDPHATMRCLAASVGDLLQQVLDQSGRTVVFRYMLEIVELDPSEGEEILVRALSGQVKEDVVTAADQLRAEGELRALRRVLLRQLREKFTDISVEAEERVAKATADELDEWTTRVVKVDTVDAVFGSSGQG